MGMFHEIMIDLREYRLRRRQLYDIIVEKQKNSRQYERKHKITLKTTERITIYTGNLISMHNILDYWELLLE